MISHNFCVVEVLDINLVALEKVFNLLLFIACKVLSKLTILNLCGAKYVVS